jgi:hypothetical protein
MFTRGLVSHQYSPTPLVQVESAGLVRTATTNGVAQTWAISRPVSAPHDGLAPPLHVVENTRHNGGLQRGGFVGLSPARPRIEADPSDSETWQREYRFT